MIKIIIFAGVMLLLSCKKDKSNVLTWDVETTANHSIDVNILGETRNNTKEKLYVSIDDIIIYTIWNNEGTPKQFKVTFYLNGEFIAGDSVSRLIDESAGGEFGIK